MNLSRKSILPETRSKKWRLLNLKAEAETKQIAALPVVVIVMAADAVAIVTAADSVTKTETAADAAAAFIAKKFAVSVPTKTSSWIIKISA
jgi:hypothetical protein